MPNGGDNAIWSAEIALAATLGYPVIFVPTVHRIYEISFKMKSNIQASENI
ncbi:hypothetical protein PEPS_13220 [Persicobacter psychrovividus]|uniref:Tryptophan synthase beta chain-like PALP domain-containing protein n=1 Tax=Persicobacter psychrovividus TaxID=387638 RepID=A0ABM7VDM8_9BACT|nr:hypothetical protein PEPS_13220 [Persicobacter psychrovividus]